MSHRQFGGSSIADDWLLRSRLEVRILKVVCSPMRKRPLCRRLWFKYFPVIFCRFDCPESDFSFSHRRVTRERQWNEAYVQIDIPLEPFSLVPDFGWSKDINGSKLSDRERAKF